MVLCSANIFLLFRDFRVKNLLMLQKLFRLKENHTDVKTEAVAGVTTFMTLSYIIFV